MITQLPLDISSAEFNPNRMKTGVFTLPIFTKLLHRFSPNSSLLEKLMVGHLLTGMKKLLKAIKCVRHIWHL